MENKVSILLSVMIMVFCILLANLSFAQERDFSGVTVQQTSTGHFIFFDQKNGRIYLYDGAMRCTRIWKVDELGKDGNIEK